LVQTMNREVPNSPVESSAPPRRTPSAGDELALLRRYREHGDENARDELVARMIPWVRRIAARFGRRGLEMDDLVQVGLVGLVKAIDRLDLNRGVRLTTYAEPTVVGEIKRHFRDHGWIVRPPRELQEMNAEVMRAIDFLTAEKRASPTVTDVATYLSVDEETVLAAMHAGGGFKPVSLDLPGGETSTQLDPAVLATQDGNLERTILRESLGESLGRLSPRDRQIMHMRFFEELTQSEIAERIGVSQMQISRVIRSALNRMRESLDEQILT
jgi:RNA polymerase sigma-B factor